MLITNNHSTNVTEHSTVSLKIIKIEPDFSFAAKLVADWIMHYTFEYGNKF